MPIKISVGCDGLVFGDMWGIGMGTATPTSGFCLVLFRGLKALLRGKGALFPWCLAVFSFVE